MPFEYIKRKVDVRLTRNTIEVLCDNDRICSHKRLYGRPNQYSTLEEHMPPNHKKYMQWNGNRFRSWATKIGEHTAAVIEVFLTANKVEQQGYKSCMALLKLAEKFTPQRLEAACAKMLSYTARPSYKSISAILNAGQDKLSSATPASKPGSHGFVRGAEYYKGGADDAE